MTARATIIAPPAIQGRLRCPEARRGNGRSGVRIMLRGDSPGIRSFQQSGAYFQHSADVSKRRQSGMRFI